ncbi:MAG: tripartite tricarboxylate transporter substrate binding protein [Betaproteobacteria bacterium]|nr:tripartite tricarboxylate transporter substrate binding protein [Betaproteobacteria bacterium]
MKVSVLVMLAISLASSSAAAQGYPAKPVRLIAPFSSGGAVDVPARIIAAKLSEMWGQGVIVENKPGAGSTIGAELVARSAPDGHTLLFTSNTHIISGSLYKKLSYDPITDFEPVIEVGSAPNVLVVASDVPAKNVGELIALAKAKPGQLDYASSGNGSSQHLFCALFASMAGIQLNHVPYKGSGQATTDLLAGRVPVSCPGVNNVLVHIRQGRLRALAVTSARRAADLPDTPTLAEAGVTGYEATLWLGILAPKGTPGDIVAKLYADLGRVLARDDVSRGFAAIGTAIEVKPGVELGKLMRAERVRWGRLIAEAGARVD